jgi:hypothetical protein
MPRRVAPTYRFHTVTVLQHLITFIAPTHCSYSSLSSLPIHCSNLNSHTSYPEKYSHVIGKFRLLQVVFQTRSNHRIGVPPGRLIWSYMGAYSTHLSGCVETGPDRGAFDPCFKVDSILQADIYRLAIWFKDSIRVRRARNSFL